MNISAFSPASSLLKITQHTSEGWPQVDFSEVGQEVVPVLTLDDYMAERSISRVKLLKIDVQGFELKVLKGCGNRIHDIEYIIAEVQFKPLYEGSPAWHELVAYVKPFGFTPKVMDGFCFAPDGQPLQADILFERAQ